MFLFVTVNRTRKSRLLMVRAVQEWPLTRLADVAVHDWDMLITPAELAAVLRRHALAPGEATGLGPQRAAPCAARRPCQLCD